MSLPVLTSPVKLREWAPSITRPTPGAPLIRSTQELEVKLVWMDGSHSADWDLVPGQATPEQVKRFVLEAMKKLIVWKAGGDDGKGGQGYRWASMNKRPPEPGWRKFPGMNFWWRGPERAYTLGKFVMRGIPGERDFDGTVGPWPIAPKFRAGEDHLNDTGGKVAYRVGGWFAVREHLVEVIRDD